MFDIEKYYDNKAFDLPQNVQDTILAYFERLQTTANMRWKNHYAAKQAGDTLKAESQLTFYHARLNALTGAKYLLEELGIYIEFDWPGHRGEWFFPTNEDNEYYFDYLQDMREDG